MANAKKIAVAAGTERPKRLYGFQNMSPERVREIASMGGRIAHQKGRAHEFTSEEAKQAGSKGGKTRKANHAARKAKSAL